MKIAHLSEYSDEVQTIQQHSLSTATLTREFTIPALKNTVYNMALLHDIGKYQPSFGCGCIYRDNKNNGIMRMQKIGLSLLRM